MLKKLLWAVTLLVVPVITASATALEGAKSIYLQDRAGAETKIGELQFTRESNHSSSYQLHLDHTLFKDYFLSMKEMKCLEGPELWCAIPYPYERPKTVSAKDLRWLEHDLLFMFKKLDSFGANFWNGIYYQLEIVDNRLQGTARSLDLNLLASPPEDLAVPPVGEFDIDDADLDQRWLPYLIIR